MLDPGPRKTLQWRDLPWMILRDKSNGVFGSSVSAVVCSTGTKYAIYMHSRNYHGCKNIRKVNIIQTIDIVSNRDVYRNITNER